VDALVDDLVGKGGRMIGTHSAEMMVGSSGMALPRGSVGALEAGTLGAGRAEGDARTAGANDGVANDTIGAKGAKRLKGAEKGPVAAGAATEGMLGDSGPMTCRFDRYFRGAPQMALDAAMESLGEPMATSRKEEHVPALRPPYSILRLRDARVCGTGPGKEHASRHGKAADPAPLQSTPFRYMAVPLNASVRDVKVALGIVDSGKKRKAAPATQTREVSLWLEWEDPEGRNVPRRQAIEDETVTFERVLASAAARGVLWIALKIRNSSK
jgi:hypothetical protein